VVGIEAGKVARFVQWPGGIEMGLDGFLLKKGIVGLIAKDLNIKYAGIKKQHPTEQDDKLLIRVWNLYLTLNEEKIRAEDGEDKIFRLDNTKERHDNVGQPGYEFDSLLLPKDLFDLFLDVLFIETDVRTSDKKLFMKAARAFVEVSKKFGLDFTEKCEGYERAEEYIGKPR
jgi:hypothetical protein